MELPSARPVAAAELLPAVGALSSEQLVDVDLGDGAGSHRKASVLGHPSRPRLRLTRPDSEIERILEEAGKVGREPVVEDGEVLDHDQDPHGHHHRPP